MFVADGAGSALRGAEGAELAVQTAVRFADAAPVEELPDVLAAQCIAAVRAAIASRARAKGLKLRDFACTFLGVLSCPAGTLAMQVGDGGIVLDAGRGLELPILPMAGQYANMTSFVTDENALTVLACRSFPRPVNRVAIFSDGLQRLVIDLSTYRPHAPFFERLFQVLGSVGEGRDAELQQALVRLLNGPAVNQRTDDDKALALAVLLP